MLFTLQIKTFRDRNVGPCYTWLVSKLKNEIDYRFVMLWTQLQI